MFVLGKTRDDKGTQLEQLTRAIAQRRGFQNIVCNPIGEGGLEIDVRAEFTRPGLTASRAYTVLCECKAHAGAIAISDWLKFLGKIYSEEAVTGREVSGCFIALSGVNGNVAGHFKSLHERNKPIELVEGDALEAEFRTLYGLCESKTVTESIACFTSRRVRRMEPFYYDGHAGWLVVFEDELYTVLAANGTLTPSGATRDLQVQLIEQSQSVKQFVDLQTEVEAVERRLRARVLLLSAMMRDEGSTSLTKIAGEIPSWAELSESDVREAAARLQEDGLAHPQADDADVWLLDLLESEPHGIMIPVERRARLYIEILNPPAELEVLLDRPLDGRLIEAALGSPFYDRGIDDELIAFVQHQQEQIPLSDEEKRDVQALCRFSPSALVLALRPQQTFRNLREQLSESELSESSESSWASGYLLRLLCDALERDFTRPGLRRYFFEQRNLREIEVHKRLLAKSQSTVELDRAMTRRQAIGELAPGYVGPEGSRLIHLELFPHASQPWESVLDQDSDDKLEVQRESPGVSGADGSSADAVTP